MARTVGGAACRPHAARRAPIRAQHALLVALGHRRLFVDLADKPLVQLCDEVVTKLMKRLDLSDLRLTLFALTALLMPPTLAAAITFISSH